MRRIGNPGTRPARTPPEIGDWEATVAGREVIRAPQEGASLRVVGDQVRVLASGQDTAGAYEVFDVVGPPDNGPPIHQHPWNEAYFVLEGELAVRLGEAEFKAVPGTFFNVPAGAWHGYRITSPRARVLIVSERASVSAFFTDVDREIGTPPDFQRLLEIAARHQVTPALPA